MPDLAEAIHAFLLTRETANCTLATRGTYAYCLERFRRTGGLRSLDAVTTEAVQQHLAELRMRMKPISVHQGFRVLRTFCRWCSRTGRARADPMDGMTMKVPKTLPRVPEDGDVRRLLQACLNTVEGRRNRALIALAADSGLRKEELRGLRISDLDFATLTIQVRAGKGQKDGVAFFGGTTASLLRAWLSAHPTPQQLAFVFVTRKGVQLGPYAILRILHRLSRRAGLDRKIGPHALRHYAATALLRRTGDLELVRRVLRHESLAMTLRYVALAQADVAAKYQHASPLDHLWARKGIMAGGAGAAAVSRTRRIPYRAIPL
jgi:site-specific recombinase XerC